MQKKKPIWSGDNFDTTAYLYYQGKDSSQLQTTRYIGKAKMIASTGEIAHLTIPNITTMPRERLWVYPEIKEINRHGTRSIISRIIQWLAGLFVVSPTADTKSQGYTPLYPTDETGSVYKYAMNHEKRSLGQDNDIKYHKRRVDSLQHHHPKINNVIMYGVSRGAATTFSALSQHQYQNVKLCIFEGIPATISAQFKFYFSNFLGKLLYNNFFVRHFIGTKHSTAK